MGEYKLTLQQVEAIRKDTRSHRAIAEAYGVTRSYVCKIQRGHRRKTAGKRARE